MSLPGGMMKLGSAVLLTVCLATGWYNVASYWAAGGRRIPVDYYPFWNASRAIVHGSNPYADELAEQNQVAIFGATSKVTGIENEQRFAYPVYAAVSVLPLGYLPFQTANRIAFVLFVGLTIFAVGWLSGAWTWTTLAYCTVALSCYPIIYCEWARQPAVLFFGMAVGGLALIYANHLVAAGLLTALSLGKPQLVIAIILAELIWTLADWHDRRRFAVALPAWTAACFAGSWVASPGWVKGWLATVRLYAHYNQPSLLVSVLGPLPGYVVSFLLLLALIAVLWWQRNLDLRTQASLSIVVVQLLVPYADYNAIILLVPAVWMIKQARTVIASGELNAFMLNVVRVVIVLFLLLNVVGIALFHGSHFTAIVGWILTDVLTHILLFSLVGLMIAYYLTGLKGPKLQVSVEAHEQSPAVHAGHPL